MAGELSKQISVRIREAREARQVSAAELARLVGLSRSRITELEQGTTTVSADHLESISRALQVPVSALMPGAAMPALGPAVEPAALPLLRAVGRRDVHGLLAACADLIAHWQAG